MKKSFHQEILDSRGLFFRLALQILHNHHDAEDAVSDFCLKVLEKKEIFSRYDNRKGALIRSMKNHCFNQLKMKKRQQSIRKIPEGVNSNSNHSFSDDKRLQLVQKIINGLPEKQRIMIHLRMVEGYTMAQIADVMDEKVNTVEVAISRARKKIKAEYENRRSQ